MMTYVESRCDAWRGPLALRLVQSHCTAALRVRATTPNAALHVFRSNSRRRGERASRPLLDETIGRAVPQPDKR
jgi:hypothetical protein